MSKTGEAYIESSSKRAFDIVGASILLGPALCLMGGAALALCAERQQFNPLFRQQRIGRGQLPFLLTKLRTLPEQETQDYFETFGVNDPRASRLGQYVRKIGIDELPQLASVLRGEMSLNGIRPQVPTVLEQRRALDTPLFDDWYYCYERNIGMLGPGQAYAHTVGTYTENQEIVRTLMRIDVEAFEAASLQNDIATVFGQPVNLVRSAFSA